MKYEPNLCSTILDPLIPFLKLLNFVKKKIKENTNFFFKQQEFTKIEVSSLLFHRDLDASSYLDLSFSTGSLEAMLELLTP